MRTTVYLLLLFTGLTFAENANSQNARVDLNKQQTKMKEVLDEIERQTDYLFISNRDINLDRRVSIQAAHTPVREVLNEILENTDIGYVMEGINIILTQKSDIRQQERVISGVVYDSDGLPMPGVNVVVKGTVNGVVTDTNGKYNIKVPDKATVLVFSFVGYATREMPIENKNTIDVALSESAQAIEEVVIVAYGTQKKINLTGSVSQISGDILESRPVTSISNALQGIVPGLNFSTNANGGELNNNMAVNIRGTGTIGTGSTSSPLILIDGIAGDMNTLNPQDIESISVLKDAASAAVYGSRAPFGVILITTKKGKAGKPVISYNFNMRLNNPVLRPEMLDSYRFANYFNDGCRNGGLANVIPQSTIDNIIAYQNGELDMGTTINTQTGLWNVNSQANSNTDWYRAMYQDWAQSQEHAINVRGGNESITYYVSGSYLHQNGLLRFGNDNLSRYNLSGKIDIKLNQYSNLMYSTRYVRNEYDKPTYLSSYFYQQLTRRWPTNPVYDPNGFPMDGSDINRLENGGRTNALSETWYHQLMLTIKPVTDWGIYLEGNFRPATTFTHGETLPVFAYDAVGNPYPITFNNTIAAGQSGVSEAVTKSAYYTTNIYSDYAKTVGDGHNFKVMAGFNCELNQTKSFSAARDTLIVADMPEINVAVGKDKTTSSKTHWATAGFFGRLNYNYKDRYMVEFNGRYDGTSRFTRDKRWNFFPSFSMGWNVAREGFWGNITRYVNELKFKASWGELGNQNTSSLYPFYETIPFTKEGSTWILNGNRPNTAGMPGIISAMLTWERVQTTNIGLDFGAFSNRLTGSVEVFRRKTLDMVGPAPSLPAALGATAPRVNNADMESRGYDIEFNWRDAIGKFRYGVRLTLSDAVQKVTRYPNANGTITDWYDGKKLGEIWGFETKGIAKTQQEMDEHLAAIGGQNNIGRDWGAGDVMYANLDGAEGITRGANTLENHGDVRIIGNSSSRYQYGIMLDCQWHGFDFSAFFQGVGKRDYDTGTSGDTDYQSKAYFWGVAANTWQSVGYVQHWDYFRPEGDPSGANLNAYYPRPIMNSEKNHRSQTAFLLDASYLRLKNVQLGYQIPVHLTQKIGISRLRVYVSGENLLTFTKLTKLYDPETLDGAGGWGTGKTYPLSKVISFGLNLNF